MIMPDKYVAPQRSLLGQSAALLECARPNQSVSELWAAAKMRSDELNYGRFLLALDLLYTLGTVTLDKGVLSWRRST